MSFLPPYLLNAWRLQHGEEERAKNADELKGWTVSSLAESQTRFQLDNHYAAMSEKSRTSSLSSMAVGRVLDVLRSSTDLHNDAITVADSLSSTTLRQLLEDPRTPYQVLRVFNALPQTLVEKNRRIVDIDEAVIRNEHHIRSRGTSNRDGKYLVSLEELCSIVSEMAQDVDPIKATHSTDKKLVTVKRRDPPKGSLEVLDYWRPRHLSFNPNDKSFSEVFDRITKGILRGLDWRNIMVAGGMALTTLLHIDPTKDNEPKIKNPDIDLYIYGLNPGDANRKAEEIHDTWVRNLPASATKKLVVKNAKTINFLTDYPNRRIQIVLKLLSTPTDVLLNFDLDACAIGFDGSSVFMLPRCARAIETGYSVFTMDLVWGHHLGDRRASQDNRIFKYADRGFGLRFLPSYARSLEEEHLDQALFGTSPSSVASQEISEADQNYEHFRWAQRNRKPDGSEPGIKTLQRIAYLGQDYVHRFYFGATSLSLSPRQMQEQLKAQNVMAPNDDGITDADEQVWQELYDRTERENRTLQEANDLHRANHELCDGPRIRLSDLDSEDIHTGLPDGRRGLGNLEIFMRHCEAWKLHSNADAHLDMNQTASLAYDTETYDDFPNYDWNENFDIDGFARTIENYNENIWTSVKDAICGKLGINSRRSGYANYSTRRIRRQVWGQDLKSVQEKQITIPVNVPFSLENFLLTTLPQDSDDLPSGFTNFKPLIPVHDSSKYLRSTAVLPSLRDTAAENGNLRYWVITNENMWASQHRVLDEFAEVMWSLFHWFTQAMTSASAAADVTTLEDISTSCWRLARSFRRRIVLPEVTCTRVNSATTRSDLPSLRESLLFRPWALTSPAKPDREHTQHLSERDELFDEECVLYPFPDDFFWDPSDEGTWGEDGVPEWAEAPLEKVAENEKEQGIYSQKNKRNSKRI